MENDLLKLNIEAAAKEIARRPLGSNFLILAEEQEKIELLSQKIISDFENKLKENIRPNCYIYDCKLKMLSDRFGKVIPTETNVDKSILKEVCKNIDNSIPCVLLILNFDFIHLDKKLNIWNQKFINALKGNELNNHNLLHCDSIIIAGYTGKGDISNSLSLINFELI